MQLDYIENINEYGDNIVRLYDFNKAEATKFRQAIQETIITKQQSLKFTTLDFVQSRNCNLTLRITDKEEGISRLDKINFFCDLTIEGYKQMVLLLEPFCNKETKGYQWLYDIDNQTDFLFSPSGTW